MGGTYSSINLRLIKLSESFGLIQLSYSASSTELQPYKSFLRTIPADDIQAHTMIEFVKKLGASAVSIVYRDDPYGRKGYEELQKSADAAQICISVAVKVSVNVNKEEAFDILDKLRHSSSTRIVIIFAIYREAHELLKVANDRDSNKEFVWIGSDSWGLREIMLDSDTGEEALGSFSVVAQSEDSPEFKEYWKKLQPKTNTRNPFFLQWWETSFKCKVPNEASPNPPNKCSEEQTRENFSEDTYSDSARKAIWSIGLGLSAAMSKVCANNSKCLSSITRTELNMNIVQEELKKVELMMYGQKRRVFTDRGDGNVEEVIYNVHLNGSSKFYSPVSTIHMNEIRMYCIEMNM